MKPSIYFYGLAIWCCFLVGLPQSNAQLTTVGKEFWVSFMDNNTDGYNGRAVITISANEAAKGTIDLSGITSGLVYHFDLQAGENYTMRIPEYDLDLLNRHSGVIENKGIFVSSTGKISVYAFNERLKSADGTVVLPNRTLGKSYIVTSHYETTYNNIPGVDMNVDDESTMMVVAVEDQTTVEIVPSAATVDGKQKGTPFQILLNRGQSYQLKSKEDLTGTRVKVVDGGEEDCKNIAVFGGNKWTTVGACGSAPDHLFQQMYPLNTWGKEVVHVPLKTRSSGELVKIVAAEDQTEVRVNGTLIGTIDAGEWLERNFGPEEIATITSSNPTSVTTFSKSRNCNVQNDSYYAFGDPFMMTYNPNERLLERVAFEAMDIIQIQYHYVNIIVKTSAKGSTYLDGNAVGNAFQTVPGNAEFSYAQLPISGGVHQLSNAEGLIAYVYGFGDLESYGYAVGANLENLNFPTTTTYEDFDVTGDNVTCLGNEFTWTVTPQNPLFDHFVWNIEGAESSKVGASIRHQFDAPGRYQVTIYASDGPTTCDHIEEIKFEVEVLETAGEIHGQEIICPASAQATYSFTNLANVHHVKWLVNGGELLNINGNSAEVKWDTEAENSFIAVIPFTAEGCPGEQITQEITVWGKEIPETPIGETAVCFDPETSVTYELSDTSEAHGYQWHVSGGTIVGNQNQQKVAVKWDKAETAGEVWYEVFHEALQTCRVTSEKLEVMVRGEIQATYEVENVLCEGTDSGKISLQVTGGEAPYQYTWSHDANLKSGTAADLPAGTYSVEITDQLGCTVLVDEMAVLSPAPMHMEVLSNPGTTCHDAKDGEVRLVIDGGVGPFQVDQEDAVWQDNVLTLSGLSGGEHQLIFADQNGCEFEYSFVVPHPEPLQVTIDVLSRACPGEANGELVAIPAGGTAPYRYTWDYQASTGQAISGIAKGQYAVMVQDGNGCIGLASQTLTEQAPTVRMPTGFYPEGGGVNRIYQPISNCAVSYNLKIYSRWGELLYSGRSGWDGTIADHPAKPGAYTYLLQYDVVIGGRSYSQQMRGLFTLVE